jgi:O-antigen ligase
MIIDRIQAVADELLFILFCLALFFIPVATSPSSIFGGAVLIFWLISGLAWRDRAKWWGQAWVYPFFAYALLHWVGLFWSPDVKLGLKFALKTYYWLFALAIISIPHDESHIRKIMYFYLGGISFTAIVSLLQYLEIIPMHNSLPSGYIGHIAHSLLLVFGMVVASTFFRKNTEKKKKGIFLGIFLLLFCDLMVAWGRSGYLAFGVLLPVMIYDFSRFKRYHIVAGISLAVLVLLFLSPTVQSRVQQVVLDIQAYRNMNVNTSNGLRIHMWSSALQSFAQHPWMGTGTGGYQHALAQYNGSWIAPQFRKFDHPHNSLLYMLSSFGIPGLLVIIWMFWFLIKYSWLNKDTLAGRILFLYTVIMIVGSLSETQIVTFSTGSILAILTGFLAWLYPMAQARQQQKKLKPAAHES